MALFEIKNSKIFKIATIKLDKEKNIQKLFEENLEEILDIIFLASEYSTSFGGRIDTLGIDRNGLPVIIEYKKNQNDNIINQGLSYLKWLLDHKAEFENLCRNKKISIKIDWTSPRVICIAGSYNKFDLDTAEILPIKIELMKYKIYEKEILQLEREDQGKVIRPFKIHKKSKIEKEFFQKPYTVESHIKKADKEIKKIYLDLKEKIMSLDNSITEEPKKRYIAYKLTTNFVDVIINKTFLKIFLNIPSGKLKDPYNLARDLVNPKKIGHWGNGDYEVKIHDIKNLDRLFELIKQSYDYNK